jgi:nicotinamidase-related amidase
MGGFVLVNVDVQRDFLDPTMASVGSWPKAFCVPGIERLVTHAHESGWQVIHVGTVHRGADSLPAHQRRRGLEVYCRADSPGCEFVVEPDRDEVILYKSWYSAFDAELANHLDEPEAIVWTGVATDCCIQQSAFDADRRGIRSLIPIQAVSASSCDTFVASLVALGKSSAEVVDLDDLLRNGPVTATPLGSDDIRQAARAWFERQKALLPSEPEGLDDLLKGLHETPPFED